MVAVAVVVFGITFFDVFVGRVVFFFYCVIVCNFLLFLFQV